MRSNSLAWASKLKAADDEHVEAGLHRLAGGGGHVEAHHGAIFRADHDGGAALGAVGQRVALPFRGLPHANPPRTRSGRPGFQGREDQTVALWACCTPAFFSVSITIWAKSKVSPDDPAGGGPRSPQFVEQAVIMVHGGHAWGERLSTVKGPATRTRLLSS